MKRNLAAWKPTVLVGAVGLIGAFAAASASCSGNSTSTYLPDGGAGMGSVGKGGSVGDGGSSGAETGGSASGQAGDTSGMGGDGGVGGGAGGGGEAGSPGAIGPQPFAYEPFDYAVGLLDNPTSENNGGFGWFGPWDGSGAQVAADGLWHASAMNSLVSSGGTALVPQAGSPYVFRSIDLAAVPASLRDQNDKVGSAGAVLWLSFLAHTPTVPQPVGAVAGVQLYDGDVAKRFIGLQYYTTAEVGLLPNWGVGHDGDHGTYTGVSVTVAALLVVRFEFATEPGGNSTTMLWVNPDIDERPTLGVPDTQLDAPDFRFDRIAVGGDEAETYIDEIRFGESYESVTPVR
jgi:hypothetical protein